MVTPSFRFLYHFADVQHNQWTILVQGQGNRLISTGKFIGKFWLRVILILIITSQGTCVQHDNKMICHVQTLVCMVKVTGNDNNSLNIHNHRLIKKNVHHDKTMCRIYPRLKSQVIFAVENLLPYYYLQSL